MYVNFFVLFEPSVHLVEFYFDEVFEVTIGVKNNCVLGSATPHYEVICGGRCTFRRVIQVFFRQRIWIEKI